MKENGGCLNRICGSVGDTLYAVASSSTGNIAVAGADRTVTIYDPRRFVTLMHSGLNKVKYVITLLVLPLFFLMLGGLCKYLEDYIIYL